MNLPGSSYLSFWRGRIDGRTGDGHSQYPAFFPIITSLGFSPILFGVLAVRAIEMKQITPPVALNIYIIEGIAPDISIGQIFIGVIPFLIADAVPLPILIGFPQICLFLPSLMKR